MSRTRTSVGVGLSALASLGVAAYMSGRRAVPGFTGTVHIPTLDGTVDVLRDAWGVPSVFASTDADAYRVQGWLHAADRTFQLDLLRRIGMGRLAELVGEPGLASDRLIRTLGFPRLVAEEFAELDDADRARFTAYAEGVNAAFSRARRRVPVEYRLVRQRPADWQPQECLALSRIMALGLCGNWESELGRGEITARFGADVVAAIEGDEHVGTWQAQLHPDVLGELTDAIRDVTSSFGGPGGIGSNNWVIGPRRTRDGGAILANDPHLDLQLPSVWYEQRLSGEFLDVRGFTFPGVPGVVLGHNGRIAWGFTNSSIDVQDTYLETLDESQTRYRDTDGEWHDLDVRHEQIPVKGRASEQLTIRSTRRGPIITDIARSRDLSGPLSMRWDSIGAGRSAQTVDALNRATNWSQFREALRGWRAPAQNVVYADAEGNIGYQHMGEVPIRADGNDGSVPRAGDDPAGEWLGTVPWDELPSVFNPPAARIVTANDRLVGDDYPYFLSREWMNGYRGERIRTLIDSIEQHAVGDQVRIQTDVLSIPGRRMCELLSERAPAPTTASGRDVLAALLRWDGELRAGSDESTAWRLLQHALQDETFGFLGELLGRFLGYSRTGVNGFWAMFGRSTPRILDAIDRNDRTMLEAGVRVAQRRESDSSVPEPLDGWQPHESWDALLTAALDRAGAWFVAGVDPDERTDSRSRPAASAARSLGRRAYHRLRLQHPLGMVPGFSRVANRGPFAMPGDTDTVWQAVHYNNPLNEYAMVGPSHRHIVDMDDVDKSVAVLCGGQSGHPASPHYADQVSLWRRGAVRPAPFSRAAIERATRYRQTFTSR